MRLKQRVTRTVVRSRTRVGPESIFSGPGRTLVGPESTSLPFAERTDRTRAFQERPYPYNSEEFIISDQQNGPPDEHLVDENAECPPVDRLVVSFALNYLRRQVLGRPAQRPRTVHSQPVAALELLLRPV